MRVASGWTGFSNTVTISGTRAEGTASSAVDPGASQASPIARVKVANLDLEMHEDLEQRRGFESSKVQNQRLGDGGPERRELEPDSELVRPIKHLQEAAWACLPTTDVDERCGVTRVAVRIGRTEERAWRFERASQNRDVTRMSR